MKNKPDWFTEQVIKDFLWVFVGLIESRDKTCNSSTKKPEEFEKRIKDLSNTLLHL